MKKYLPLAVFAVFALVVLAITPPPARVVLAPDVVENATLVGEYACLPHADTEGPKTGECALGIHAQDGKYYALDMSGITAPSALDEVRVGDIISVTGTLVPVGMVTNTQWKRYAIEYIMAARELAPVAPE